MNHECFLFFDSLSLASFNGLLISEGPVTDSLIRYPSVFSQGFIGVDN